MNLQHLMNENQKNHGHVQKLSENSNRNEITAIKKISRATQQSKQNEKYNHPCPCY